jgi:hypothetical protein
VSTLLCLLCNEPTYRANVDYICGSCVQLLLEAEQADLKRAHNRATEKGYRNKTKAIQSFLIPEEINVRETKKHKRNMGRKRPVRTIRPSRDKIRA